MELKSQGIGAVAMAGKSIGAKVAFKFLDPILALAALIIAVIDLFGSTGAVGNDKADVGPQGADFDLDHDSSLFVRVLPVSLHDSILAVLISFGCRCNKAPGGDSRCDQKSQP
jgi:hypothetical protein